MDRNSIVLVNFRACILSLSARRAWIEIVNCQARQENFESLSARRAWIEIKRKGRARRPGQVALRKESVDRNNDTLHTNKKQPASLSARRAWIEIVRGCLFCEKLRSLSARRAWIEI